jgi:hypothetical protein
MPNSRLLLMNNEKKKVLLLLLFFLSSILLFLEHQKSLSIYDEITHNRNIPKGSLSTSCILAPESV